MLSLNTNYLQTLPNTISFCRQLEELNLEKNGFSYLPGVILQLKSLKTLRRWGNSELMRGAGALSHDRCNKYISMAPEMLLGSSQEAPGGEVTPLKLLALQRIMTSRIDYWESSSLAPVVCKILDNAQSQFKICDHCFVAKPLEVRGECACVFTLRYALRSECEVSRAPYLAAVQEVERVCVHSVAVKHNSPYPTVQGMCSNK